MCFVCAFCICVYYVCILHLDFFYFNLISEFLQLRGNLWTISKPFFSWFLRGSPKQFDADVITEMIDSCWRRIYYIIPDKLNRYVVDQFFSSLPRF